MEDLGVAASRLTSQFTIALDQYKPCVLGTRSMQGWLYLPSLYIDAICLVPYIPFAIRDSGPSYAEVVANLVLDGREKVKVVFFSLLMWDVSRSSPIILFCPVLPGQWNVLNLRVGP